MAPSRPRRTALLVLSLLLLSAIVAHATRDAAAAVGSTAGHAELQGQHSEVDSEEAAGQDEPCGGGGGGGGETAEGEECLMRRTLAAHTDYIYTQGGGHN